MGTEYRHGIPSVAHIEAATRLGLDWHRLEGRTWRFEMRNGEIFGDSNPHRTYLPYLQSAVGWQNSQLRPIRTDGTTVDWGVLDAEVARVQRGPQCEDCEGTGRVYGATHDGSRTCSECNGRGYALRPEAVAQPAQPQPRPTVQTQPAQPEVRRHGGIEPRRFADVRPDRHGWRWWRECTRSGSLSERFETRDGRCRWMSAHSEAWFDDRQNPGLYRRTVIPTDEQGNPVFWESIAQPATVAHQHEWVYDGLGGGHNGQYYHNCACGERDWFAEPIRSDTAQRQREEREAQRQRMAALQAQLAEERAARTAEPQPELTRFDLLECDPKANPAVSIAAWEARQKRSAVRPMPQPQPAPHRLFEVVDAEADGLRPGAVFTALLGRALNPNC